MNTMNWIEIFVLGVAAVTTAPTVQQCSDIVSILETRVILDGQPADFVCNVPKTANGDVLWFSETKNVTISVNENITLSPKLEEVKRHLIKVVKNESGTDVTYTLQFPSIASSASGIFACYLDDHHHKKEPLKVFDVVVLVHDSTKRKGIRVQYEWEDIQMPACGPVFTIDNVSHSTAGEYRCSIHNGFPPALEYIVPLLVPPEIRAISSHVTAEPNRGLCASLQCLVMADVNNDTHVTPMWSKWDKIDLTANDLQNNTKYTITDKRLPPTGAFPYQHQFTLTIRNVTNSDFAIYTCFGSFTDYGQLPVFASAKIGLTAPGVKCSSAYCFGELFG